MIRGDFAVPSDRLAAAKHIVSGPGRSYPPPGISQHFLLRDGISYLMLPRCAFPCGRLPGRKRMDARALSYRIVDISPAGHSFLLFRVFHFSCVMH